MPYIPQWLAGLLESAKSDAPGSGWPPKLPWSDGRNVNLTVSALPRESCHVR